MGTKAATAKKPVPAGKTVVATTKTAPGTAVVSGNMQEEIRRLMEEQKVRLGSAGGGKKIQVSTDKKFILPDGTETPGPVSLVIVDFVYGNFFYDRPFNKKEQVPPACFALSPDAKAMVPSDNSPDKQASECSTCPNNEFGSKGEGKACANRVHLAVTTPDAGPEDGLYVLGVSPTASKAFNAYVATLQARHSMLPVQVITEVSFDESSDYPKLRFANVGVNDKLEAHFTRRADARTMLMAEPDVSQYQPPKKAGRK